MMLIIQIRKSFISIISYHWISHEIKNGEYADYRIHIAYDADAIQSIAGAEAALSEWGVELSVDEEGSITSVVD